MKCNYEKLSTEEVNSVKELLKEENLPFEDIEEHINNFIVAKYENKIIGVVGLEIINSSALLRSLAVKKEFRNKGIGQELYNCSINYAKQKGIDEIGLLTNTAEKFFYAFGFSVVDKDNIPSFIKGTKEFQIYCPSSSTIMIKKI